jgi:hypothetical protein
MDNLALVIEIVDLAEAIGSGEVDIDKEADLLFMAHPEGDMTVEEIGASLREEIFRVATKL